MDSSRQLKSESNVGGLVGRDKIGDLVCLCIYLQESEGLKHNQQRVKGPGACCIVDEILICL